MDMQSEVLKCIADLRALGVEIWLDDFGCGFAGLSWLRAIEFQTVKVDRTFLHDCSNPRGLTMLQDMIALIRNRGNTIWWKASKLQHNFPFSRIFASTASVAFIWECRLALNY